MFHCKQLFEVDKTPKEQRMKLISIHLEGKHYSGIKHSPKKYQEERGDGPVGVYRLFGEQVRGGIALDPRAELKNLKQEGTVNEYHKIEASWRT